MSADVDTWCSRAAWCITHAAEYDARATARLKRWAHLEATLPPRELLAAAHQGLDEGKPRELVEGLERGCLAMAGGVGEGKTTAEAWRCYESTASVVWLYAPEVALLGAEAMTATLAAIRAAGIAVLDDVGAPGSSGKWETPKVAMVISALTAHPLAMISTNLSREAFAAEYDGGGDGRLVDRLEQRPNRFVEIPVSEVSRRATAVPPPDGLPPREDAAKRFLTLLQRCRQTEQAHVMADVDAAAVLEVARVLGVRGEAAIDAKVRAHDDARRQVDEAIARLTGHMVRAAGAAESEE